MVSAFLIVSPSHRCDARLAIAAVRAGETGILDLGYGSDRPARDEAVRRLVQHVGSSSRWGLRWDALADPSGSPTGLKELLAEAQCPLLILAGIDGGASALREKLEQGRKVAGRVLLEVTSFADALAGQDAGFDGVIVKGHEAGGRVGEESTFLLLQRLHGRLRIPYWAQGGIGPDTAAAAFLAGAAGVVLGEQLWLATESPLEPAERRQWSQVDGSETVCVGEGDLKFRFYTRSGSQAVHELQKALAGGVSWPVWLCQRLAAGANGSDLHIPLGQEIAFARILADKHVTVGGILEAFRQQIHTNLDTARRDGALAADAPLARTHGTRYPILQGPMTRVSDTAAFCASVAENGALPFLALALMTGPEVRKLLAETKERLGDRPWGVGILGFVPAELRTVQMEEVLKVRPSHALIAGGRPSQAKKLEENNISTYLHVPSPGLLEAFIRDGARKFIFEGRECGGHVGPRSSFCLWQSAIDVLLRAEVDPAKFQVIFAGGIHDRLSAAMVAAAAAPLTARGMKIGVLMGTAYLFTQEAVDHGAITAEFQRQALACQETILLESGIGHATRCVQTPFAVEFDQVRTEMVRAGKGPEEIRYELELLNIGRLRIASKGVARRSDPRRGDAKAELVTIPEEEQRRQGMYMIGQVAGLRNEVVDMAELHADVCQGSLGVLAGESTELLPWRQPTEVKKEKAADIALVGMACMFPKAKDVRRYWQNICNRLDAVGEVPAERWRIEDFYSEDRLARDRVYSRWGGFLEQVFFDPVKWRIPPASLQHIEPMQLLSLEVAWQAMVDAGYDRRAFPRERAGVLFAVPGSHEMGTAYCFRTMMRHYLPKVEGLSPEVREQIYSSLEGQLPEWTEDSFPGFLGNVIAGRIAREFDLHGPNFTVDAACAASLAALFTAVEQLRSGTSDLMLVGGADGTNNPFGYMSFAKTHALSPRGKSRSFDDSGDGIALGEGIACVVLKRLADAERDGDKIYAVLKGVGASSDGKNRSLTAPYPPGQMRAVTRAYEDAQVSPASVTLIEAHGTGTAVGDNAELTTLTEVFAKHTNERQYVAVGSVKSMIGHTKTVAGLASIIKTALALKHRVLPATIGVEKPSTRVDLEQSPFYLNTETRPWVEEKDGQPRRAGVSSFGFGGTNFHVVLEEYNGAYHPGMELDWMPRAAEVFVFRRASRDEMARDLRQLEQHLGSVATENLAGLAAAVFADESNRSAQSGTCRLAIVAASVEDLRQKIQKAIASLASRSEGNDPSGIYFSEAALIAASAVCFLYPGQGSQLPNMLRDLVTAYPWSHDLFLEANELLAGDLPQALTRYLYPPPAFTDAERQQQTAALKDTRVAQPALGLVELFATELLERFGVRPAFAAGHSYGEHVALHAAGCLSRADLLRLSAHRGRVCAEVAQTCPGAMAAVQADAATTEAALKELNIPASLANLNAPDQTVIAGPVAAIDAAVEQLGKKGLRAKKVPVSAAFHTSQLAAASGAMEKYLTGITFQPPRLPVYSNTTGRRHTDEPESIRHLIARHFSEPVLFEKEVRQLHADGARLFLEVGPGRVLTDLVSRILKGAEATTLSMDAPGRDGWTQLGHVVARLAVLGLPVRLAAWFDGRGLAPQSVADFIAKARAESTPKPSDWILSPNKAEPVTPLPGRKSNRPANPAKDCAPAKTNGTAEKKIPAPSQLPVPPVSVNGGPKQSLVPPGPKPEKSSIAMTTTNGEPSVNGEVLHKVVPSSHDLFAQFQATTRLMLEAQQAQSRVLERYLETQERILLHCTQGTPVPAAAVTLPPRLTVPSHSEPAATIVETVPAATAPRPRATPTVARAPVAIPRPAAALPRLAPAPAAPVERRPNPAIPASAVNGSTAAAEKPAHVPSPSVPAASPSTSGDGPPSTEKFRQDLLEVVSARTGYPIDALDETLALEAALGIDSIKTVEIFSNLKAYHAYFRAEDQEEEELLAEFTKLKTLRDIIDSYDRRRQAHVAGTRSNDTGEPNAEKLNGSANGSVKRYTVTSVAAPLEVNGEKKNSLMATPSS